MLEATSVRAPDANSLLMRGASMVHSIWRHPANRGRRMQAVTRFFAWQFTKHLLQKAVVIPFHGRQLKCYADSTSTSAALYFSGYPDFWEMKFLQAYLRCGDNFLDIGANCGVYSVFASAYIGPTGHIDAFEPGDHAAARIEEQAELNGIKHLHVHRMAVCNEEGWMEFGFATVDATMHLRRTGEPSDSGRQVQTIRLDAFESYRQYAIGKMDIEGAEPLALAGAPERLRQANPPVWLLELAGYSTCYGVSSDAVVKQLAAAGFDCAIFDPSAGELMYTSEPWLHNVQNVLAVARSQRTFVEQRLRESSREQKLVKC
jgi:FkbM family methyltransferase